MNGIVLIDKEVGVTSFETVALVKKKLGAAKAGHAGTLDRSASGLLIVCVDGATSLQNVFMAQKKRYVSTLFTGVETDTLDRYGLVRKTGPLLTDDPDAVSSLLEGFLGDIEQVPPVFSSIHVNGERSYRRALGGNAPDPKPRPVRIEEIFLRGFSRNRYEIEALVSKGTYMRSLVRDVARRLGTCGYLESLRRIAIGPFSVDDAGPLDGPIPVLPIGDALGFLPGLEISAPQGREVSNGVPLIRALGGFLEEIGSNRYTRIICGGRLIAVVAGGERPRYFKVFKDPLRAHR
jgi:tRNA pseudouridine55 synthase